MEKFSNVDALGGERVDTAERAHYRARHWRFNETSTRNDFLFSDAGAVPCASAIARPTDRRREERRQTGDLRFRRGTAAANVHGGIQQTLSFYQDRILSHRQAETGHPRSSGRASQATPRRRRSYQRHRDPYPEKTRRIEPLRADGVGVLPSAIQRPGRLLD